MAKGATGGNGALAYGLGIIFAVIGLSLGISAWLSQAPTIATQTSVASGTALSNAGVTANTLAGNVYSFVNPVYALGPLVMIGGVLAIGFLVGKSKGLF